jgi:hypothetical protein
MSVCQSRFQPRKHTPTCAQSLERVHQRAVHHRRYHKQERRAPQQIYSRRARQRVSRVRAVEQIPAVQPRQTQKRRSALRMLALKQKQQRTVPERNEKSRDSIRVRANARSRSAARKPISPSAYASSVSNARPYSTQRASPVARLPEARLGRRDARLLRQLRREFLRALVVALHYCFVQLASQRLRPRIDSAPPLDGVPPPQ